jgi:hypothetical protein
VQHVGGLIRNTLGGQNQRVRLGINNSSIREQLDSDRTLHAVSSHADITHTRMS